jgi:hypothetical protein
MPDRAWTDVTGPARMLPTNRSWTDVAQVLHRCGSGPAQMWLRSCTDVAQVLHRCGSGPAWLAVAPRRFVLSSGGNRYPFRALLQTLLPLRIRRRGTQDGSFLPETRRGACAASHSGRGQPETRMLIGPGPGRAGVESFASPRRLARCQVRPGGPLRLGRWQSLPQSRRPGWVQVLTPPGRACGMMDWVPEYQGGIGLPPPIVLFAFIALWFSSEAGPGEALS